MVVDRVVWGYGDGELGGRRGRIGGEVGRC